MFKSLIVLILLVVAAYFTNPSADRHREMIAKAGDDRSLLAKTLGLGQVQAFITNYYSLGVGSYTKVGEKLTTIGAYGVVIVLE